MVKWTALPAVYLWLAASGSVVAMGIIRPEIVLNDIESFIALIAIIGATAQPAFATMLELWKKEQSVETELHPSVIAAENEMKLAEAIHRREVEKKNQEHEHSLAAERQKVELNLVAPVAAVLKPIKNKE